MSFKNLPSLPVFISFFLLVFILGSCEKFKGDQTIPAYLHIDSISLSTEYMLQGTESHAITDSWVYVDDILIGAFQNPSTFPVLAEGSHKVTILAGIKKNGIASTRAEYPFFAAKIFQVKFTPDSTVSLGTFSVEYTGSSEFIWMEDFEDVALSIDTTNRSTVPLSYTPSGTAQTFEGMHSGIAELTDSLNFFECITNNKFTVPAGPVYLELNFNTNNDFTVGVYVYSGLTINESPVINLVPTNGKWKKIYIELSNTIYAYPGASYFKVYISARKNIHTGNGVILLDNFKLLTGPAL